MKSLMNHINRIIRRNTVFLIINIAGLSIGLAISMILLLFVANEMSYDRHFKNIDRIIRLNSIWIDKGAESIEPICLREAYTELPAKVPGIERSVQLYRGFEVEIQKEQERFSSVKLLFSDPDFFGIFPMEFINGSASGSLGKPGLAVITEQTAQKVYGSLDAVGRNFSIGGILYTITAVVKPFPVNTHFSFDVLASMESLPDLKALGGLEFFTYYLLMPQNSHAQVSEAINREYKSMLEHRFIDFDSEFGSSTEKLKDLYLHSNTSFALDKRGSMQSVYVLSGLAFLILMLAVANFVNLFIVQGDKRAFEVGIRKTNGGSIRDIAIQFFKEATIIVLAAFLLGIFFAAAIIKPFSALIQKQIEPSLLLSSQFALGLIVLVILTILFSASYPAFYLSRFRPFDVLKRPTLPSKRRFISSVVVLQSVITIILISVILTVNRQISFLQSIPKGYNDDHVMIVGGINEKLTSHYDALKHDLMKITNVELVSGAQHVIGGGTSGQGVILHGSSDQSIKAINEYRIFPGLCEVMNFELSSGRFFGENIDLNKQSIIINQSAAKMLGIDQNPLGQKLVMFDEPLELIGVVKDFYYDSPAEPVMPVAFTAYIDRPYYLYIKFNPDLNKAEAPRLILPVIRRYDPEFILNPRWCDDIYSNKFQRERSLSGMITAGTILSILIAMMGIFAIHSYSAEKRTKEIGIRKILGGRSLPMIGLLTSEILKYVVIAGIVAVPASWIIAGKWLENYANRIEISGWILALPVIMQLVFAIAATLMVSFRIIREDPVKALRYE